MNCVRRYTFPLLTPLFLQRNELGALVSLEMGKILTEGIGEVQEFVDIVSSKSKVGQATQFLSMKPIVIVLFGLANNGGNTSLSMHTV
jgi:hypothetical protein